MTIEEVSREYEKRGLNMMDYVPAICPPSLKKDGKIDKQKLADFMLHILNGLEENNGTSERKL